MSARRAACSWALFAACVVQSAVAGTRLVTTDADSGAGSLRVAVEGAFPGDVVAFDPALDGRTITLTSGRIAVLSAITIQGNGPERTRVSGGSTQGIFLTRALSSQIVIRNLTLADGNAGAAGRGGAIDNFGILRLEGVRLTGNRAGIAGGAIRNVRGGLTGGVLEIIGSTLDDNRIDASNCGSGAAIRSESPGSSVVVVNSTLAGNVAGPACSGGAIAIGAGSLLLVSSTIGPNQGGLSGGNLYKGSRGATITLRNSVLVEGAAALNTDVHGAAVGLSSLGHSLVGDRGDASGFVASDLAAGTAALLGALASSGAAGLPVRVPMAGSPLVDGVPTAACVGSGGGPLTADQRGVVRPQGAACDIGAVERAFGLDDQLFANGFE